MHTCAVCDGNLYKGSEHIAIVGGGDAAITEAFHLAKLAKKVSVLVRGSELKSVESERKQQLLALPNVEVLYRTTIQRLEGKDGLLSHLVTKDKEGNESMIAVQALFLAIGSTPNTQMFSKQLELDQYGHIILHDVQATTKEGVFAIGDATDPIFRQAITAAGTRTKTRTLQVEKYLSSHPQKHEAHRANSYQKVKRRKKFSVVRNFDHLRHKGVFSSKHGEWSIFMPIRGPMQNPPESYMTGWSKTTRLQSSSSAKVDIDQTAEGAKGTSIRAIPTVLYFESR